MPNNENQGVPNGETLLISRARALFDYLQGRLDRWVPAGEVRDDLNKKLADSIDVQAYRKAAYYLKSSMCPNGYDVHVSEKWGFKLEQVKMTRYMQRSIEHPDLKMGLGYITWDWLLDIGPEDESDREFSYRVNPIMSESVGLKRAQLRAKAAITIVADGGSTTAAGVRALLDVERMPIRPVIKAADSSRGAERRQSRFITPSIITNSPSITSMITQSRHVDAISLTLIGGRFQPDLSSICGDLSAQCLRSWGSSGSWKTDVALIGATGCWPHPHGSFEFSCEDLQEAHIKAHLLEMACLRVIVMDSSKLLNYPAGHSFAPLHSRAIDVVVTDDGLATGASQHVDDLYDFAASAGVMVVILKSR